MVLFILAFLAKPIGVSADNAGLVIREIKITGDEFMVLQNDGPDIGSLSDYWLGYIGDDSSTPPPVQRLPDTQLLADHAILLSGGGAIDTCDASIVDELSPSLSDTKGSIALWRETASGFEYLTGDQTKANWNKSTSSYTVPGGEIDLKDQTSVYTDPVWYFDDPNGWSLANFSGCQLTSYQSSSSGTVVDSWPQNASNPPAVIVSIASDQSAPMEIPNADKGLKAPQLSELLPNPSGTGNDSTDEFIELYNPNDSSFDLSGFVLQSGLTTKHKYTFPAGTVMSEKSFNAFYSEETGLSLSNSGGQVELIDPLGTTISSTESYKSAKDGESWSLANDQWFWTNNPTPGSANVVSQTASGKAGNSSTKSGGSVQGASKQNGSTASSSSFSSGSQPTPIHAWTLAGVGGAALIYAGYEYRTELANHFYRIRRYIASRRTAGK